MDIDTSRYREGLPQIGVPPYRQIHAHSTGNKYSTAQNEADYHMRRPVDSGCSRKWTSNASGACKPRSL